MPMSVGDVYIDIHGDAKPFERDLRKALAKASKNFRLQQGLDDLLKTRALDKELDLMARRWGSRLAAASRRGLGNVTPEIDTSAIREDARRIAQQLGEDVEKVEQRFLGRLNSHIDAANREYAKGLEKRAKYWIDISQRASREQVADQRRAQAALERAIRNTSVETQILRTRNDIMRTATRIRELNVDLANTELRITREQQSAYRRYVTRVTTLFTRIRRDSDRSISDRFQLIPTVINRADRGLLRLRNSLRRAGTGGFFDSLTNVAAIMPTLLRTTLRFGSSAGRIFGKGFGLAASGLDAFANAGFLKRFGKFGSVLSVTSSTLARFASVAARASGPIGAVLGALAGIGLLGKTLGVMASALTSVVGVLAQLAQIATFATGSLLSFVPALAAIPPVLGAIVLGMRGVPDALQALTANINAVGAEEKAETLEEFRESLEDLAPAARKTVRALRPVIRRFQELSGEVQQRLFAGLADELGDLNPLFSRLETGLRQTARSINIVVRDIFDSFTSSEFLDDFQANFSGLQPIIRDFGTALGDFIAGLNSLITALLPSGERLSGFIADAAESFKNFTQSAEGKNKIAVFMNDAFKTAGQLKDILLTVGETIGIVFGASKDTGSDFLDGVLSKAEEFREWIRERAEDGRLQRWFADVKNIAGEVWGAIQSVAEVIDRLDTGENRDALQGLLQGFQSLMEWLETTFIPFAEGIWDEISAVWNAGDDLFYGIKENISDFLSNYILPILKGIEGLSFGEALIGDVSGAIASIENIADEVDRVYEDRGVPPWGDALIGKLIEAGQAGDLADRSVTTLLTSAQSDAPFAPNLVADVTELALKGQITKGELEKILEDKTPPGWPTNMDGLLSTLVSTGELSAREIAKILEEKGLPGWAKEGMKGALLDIVNRGKLSDEEMETLLRARNLPNWLAQALAAKLDEGKGKASDLDRGLEVATRDRTANIKVTDNGSANATQALINAIEGKTVTVAVRLQRQNTLQAAIGGSLAGDQSGLPRGAAVGGLFTNPQHRLIGEAGPEAVIPLTRPLGQVDSSVRDLAALLRGEGGVGGRPQKVVNLTMNVTSVQADPEAVAESVVNRAVALAR